VRAGERLAVLGSNGCGKSTLLKLLDGLILASSGTVRAFGVDLTAKNLQDEKLSVQFRRRVGFIFQRSDVQLFSPTVREEIAFGPLHLGIPQAEVIQRVEDVIEMLGLEALRDRAPYQLSGGEQKKVAIASVLSVNPQALLLDEPTAALDPRTQRWLIDLLQKLHASGKTTILATHDLDLIPQLADRVIVIGQDHTIWRDGPGAEVLADHHLLHQANLAHHHLAIEPRSVDPGAGPARPPVIEPAQVHGAHDHEKDDHESQTSESPA
jgi:cobalt/nickel transport system ATP-binding protein